jgi:uncharacterized protein
MPVLDNLRYTRIAAVPLAAPHDHTLRQRWAALRRALLPALAAAHAAGTPIVVAWCRLSAGAPITVLAGGGLVSGGSCVYPPGVVTEPVPSDAVDRLRAIPRWLRCGGRHDSLVADEPDDIAAITGAYLEDLVTHLGPEPFCWLVHATPIPEADLRRRLEDVRYASTSLFEHENTSLADAVAVEQHRGLHRDLARSTGTGGWYVRLLVGGADDGQVRRVAGLLCAASDLYELPYVLNPLAGTAPFDETIRKDEAPDGRYGFAAIPELLTAIARPPFREIPGIRVVERPEFDLNPEHQGEVPLGRVIDARGREVGDYAVPTSTLNRHAFVTGATGAGKSQTVRRLLEGLHRVGVPWLVIEPAKAEYAGMAGRMMSGGDLRVIRPGDPDQVPASLNPLEPADGFPLATHLDLVGALFLAAFEAAEPFPQVLAQAMADCYRDHGFDPVTGARGHAHGEPRYPGLRDLQAAALRVVDRTGYGPEIAANVRGFIGIRIGSLRLGGAGRFFEGGHPLDVAEMFRRNVVLELERIGDDQNKNFLVGAVLIRMVEHLRVHADGSAPGLRHVTVVEEAHRLLRAAAAGTPSAHAVESFAAMLAEIRAYGEGIIIADQIPAKLLPDVIKNTALKILHRLPAADDRDAVGATMNLDPAQSRFVVSLPPGEAAVFADGMDRPVLLRVPLGADRERAGEDADAPITGRRTAACGRSCGSRACTLQEIAAGLRLAEDPRAVVLVELLALAHVIGEVGPVPRWEVFDDLLSESPKRTVECAVATLAQQAVAVRYRHLADWYPPDGLAAHVAAAAMSILAGGAPCRPEREAHWQAGRYRLAAAAAALSRWTGPSDRPHPDTAVWRSRGVRLPSVDIAGQIAALRRHPALAADPRQLLFGDADPAPLRVALDRLSAGESPSEQVEAVLSVLAVDTDWLRYWVLDPPD